MSNIVTIFGADPGLTGSVACYHEDKLYLFDTPVVDKQIDMANYWDSLQIAFPPFNVLTTHGFFEKVSAMPGQGVTSMFKFGYTTGAMRMGLVALGIPITDVSPTKWKLDMGLSSDKEKSRAMAISVFPASAHLFARKKDDGRAEAALLSRYGYLKLNGGSFR